MVVSKGCRMLGPDGSLHDIVWRLFNDAGIHLAPYDKSRRSLDVGIDCPPLFPAPFNRIEIKRPRDIAIEVGDGCADIGITGTDLIAEVGYGRRLKNILDIPMSRGGMAYTRIVVAAQKDSPLAAITDFSKLPKDVRIITEYPGLAKKWARKHGISVKNVRRVDGSTESFKDANTLIVENVETGKSLERNGWVIIDEIMKSNTCLVANAQAMKDPQKRAIIDSVVMLLQAVLDARGRSLLLCNVATEKLPAVLQLLEKYGDPTKSTLADNAGYALEIVVPKDAVVGLFVNLHLAGATKILKQSVDMYKE